MRSFSFTNDSCLPDADALFLAVYVGNNFAPRRGYGQAISFPYVFPDGTPCLYYISHGITRLCIDKTNALFIRDGSTLVLFPDEYFKKHSEAV